MNLYKLNIGYSEFELYTEVIGNIDSVFIVYWHFITSIQNKDKDVYFKCICLDSFTHVDISKGTNVQYTDNKVKVVKKFL